MAKRTLLLEVDNEQLSILLSQIESMFAGVNQQRGEDTLDAEIERAAQTWAPNVDDGSFDYEVVKIAPVYRQLLRAFGNRRAECRGIYTCDNVFEFVEVLKEARAGSLTRA